MTHTAQSSVPLVDKMINQFVDKLVDEKGLNKLEHEILAEVKHDLHERVDDRLNAVILEHMPEDKLEEFENKLDSATDEDVQGFIKEAIPDLEEVLAAELVAFRATYLYS